jgi:hypothetical protein
MVKVLQYFFFQKMGFNYKTILNKILIWIQAWFYTNVVQFFIFKRKFGIGSNFKSFFFGERTPFIKNLENNQFAYGFEVSKTELF